MPNPDESQRDKPLTLGDYAYAVGADEKKILEKFREMLKPTKKAIASRAELGMREFKPIVEAIRESPGPRPLPGHDWVWLKDLKVHRCSICDAQLEFNTRPCPGDQDHGDEIQREDGEGGRAGSEDPQGSL